MILRFSLFLFAFVLGLGITDFAQATSIEDCHTLVQTSFWVDGRWLQAPASQIKPVHLEAAEGLDFFEGEDWYVYTTGSLSNAVGGLPFSSRLLVVAANPRVRREMVDWSFFGLGKVRRQALAKYRVYGKLRHFPELSEWFPKNMVQNWIFVVEGVREQRSSSRPQ